MMVCIPFIKRDKLLSGIKGKKKYIYVSNK